MPEIKNEVNFTCLALKAIKEKHPNIKKPDWEPVTSMRGKGAKGTIPCPKCGGTLHYSIAGNNGHIHGQCETENCLRWMM